MHDEGKPADAAGDMPPRDRLFALYYDELRAAARRFMGGERDGHTLQPTALVNEAFLRLAATPEVALNDRPHFMRLAAHVMHNVLVDHARRRDSQRRGGDRVRVTLTDGKRVLEPEYDLFDLSRAVELLASRSERQSAVIEMRFYAGMPVPDVARALGISERTVKAETRFALAWLRSELE